MKRCTSCHAGIRWTTHAKSGARIPVDVEPRADGNLAIDVRDDGEAITRPIDPLLDRDVPRYVSHFATCPNAAAHRRNPARAERASGKVRR